jgi:hypothetical protein
MNQQELRELLEEQLHCVQTLRVVQVQLLAESDRDAETKRHLRHLADAAWKRYHAISQQLIDRYKNSTQSHETLPWFISQ